MWKEEQSRRVRKERKPTLRGKWESVFSGRPMDNVQKETHAVSVMTQWPPAAEAKARDKKDDRLLPDQIRRQRTDEGESKILKNAKQQRGKLFRQKKCEIPCRYKNRKNTSCRFWHPPVCQNYKSETGCKYGRTCFFRHVEAEEKPSRKSKKSGAKGSVALLKESTQLGCVSQDSYPRKSIPREKGKMGSKHAVKFSKGTWHQQKIRKKRVHREELSQSVPLVSVVLARQN